MKNKIISILLIVALFTLVLASCNTPTDYDPNSSSDVPNYESTPDDSNQNNNVNESKKNFSQFLDSESFVPRISQSALKEQMKKYRYEGTPINEIALGFHYDGYNGGGYSASSELFGFNNDYTEEDNVANYSNQFWTEVELDGLNLPYGIKFDDSLSEVFQKIGITVDPYNSFSADPNSYTDMTLYRNDKETLVFQDLKRTQEPIKSKMPYVLIYSEVYIIELSDGQPATVQRTIKMSFWDKDAQENDVLGLFEMSVCENYNTK